MRYAVVGIVQELYFVEAESPEEARNEIENCDPEWLHPAAWETISIEVFDEEAQKKGNVMPRRNLDG